MQRVPYFKNLQIVTLVLAPWQGGDVFLVERALRSLRAQTAQPSQVIVIEYGQSHQARNAYNAMLLASPSNVERCQYPDLEKEAPALQMGLAQAHWAAELVTVLDPEFLWHPTFLEQVWREWQSSAGQCGLIYADETGEDMFGEPVDWSPRLPVYDRQRLLEYGHIHLSAMALNYRALVADGGFDNLAAGVPDWDVALRLSGLGVRHIAEPLVHRFSWQTENVEPALQMHYAKNIAARINAGMYGAEAGLQLQNWKTESSPALKAGEQFARNWRG